jgi:hypothetical protein
MHGVTMSGAPENDPPSRTINVRVQDIQAGLAEADRGEFASEAEVEAVYQRYGA